MSPLASILSLFKGESMSMIENTKIQLDPIYKDKIESTLEGLGNVSKKVIYDCLGEKYNHYILLSSLIAELLNLDVISNNAVLIATKLLKFELTEFEPFGYKPLSEASNQYYGNILYGSDIFSLCTIKSERYPEFEVMLTIVQQPDMALNSGCWANLELSYIYTINVVMSV